MSVLPAGEAAEARQHDRTVLPEACANRSFDGIERDRLRIAASRSPHGVETPGA